MDNILCKFLFNEKLPGKFIFINNFLQFDTKTITFKFKILPLRITFELLYFIHCPIVGRSPIPLMLFCSFSKYLYFFSYRSRTDSLKMLHSYACLPENIFFFYYYSAWSKLNIKIGLHTTHHTLLDHLESP